MVNTMKTKEQLLAKIGKLSEAERITNTTFAELSRELLEYLYGTSDVRPINALLGMNEDGTYVLTAANYSIACNYFKAFVAFSSNWDDVSTKGITTGRRTKNKDDLFHFIKQSKDKRYQAFAKKAKDFLANPDNNIWTWKADNIKTDVTRDYAKGITNAVTKALKGDDNNEPLDAAKIMEAVFEGGLSVGDVFAIIETLSVEAA